MRKETDNTFSRILKKKKQFTPRHEIMKMQSIENKDITLKPSREMANHSQWNRNEADM